MLEDITAYFAKHIDREIQRIEQLQIHAQIELPSYFPSDVIVLKSRISGALVLYRRTVVSGRIPRRIIQRNNPHVDKSFAANLVIPYQTVRRAYFKIRHDRLERFPEFFFTDIPSGSDGRKETEAVSRCKVLRAIVF